MYTQWHTIEGQVYSESSRVSDPKPWGNVFVCPICGDAWAKIGVQLGGVHEKYFINALPCRFHQYHMLAIPGSVWLDWDKEYVQALPLDVLTREFTIHYEFVVKKTGRAG